jgi:ABC-type nitrate/sulfonate/bicarbonate transport system substrate-binding protein
MGIIPLCFISALFQDTKTKASMFKTNHHRTERPSMTSCKTLRLVAMVAAAFILNAPATSAQDKKLIIGYTARDLNNFPLFAAQAKGFFKEAGKDVEIVQMRSNIGLAGVLGGSVDYYTSFSSAVTLAAQQGSPIVGIFSMIARPSLFMISRPEIRSMAELKGKIIGLGSVGGITVEITRRMLASYGVAASDFTIVSTGDLPVRMAAVKSGAIHATLAGPPAPSQAKDMGLNVLASAADTVDFPLAGLSTSTAKIKSNRAEVVAVLTAMLRGLQFVHSQRAEAVALIQKIFKMERALAEAGYDQTLKAYSKDGTASSKGIESVLEVARQQGPGKAVTVNDVVDFGPLREAQAALKLR